MRGPTFRGSLAALTAAGLGAAALGFAGRASDRRLNPVVAGSPRPVSDEARGVHARLSVADLHADTLLWPRDLLRLHCRGHVDLPRLLAGRVGLQVFSVVTRAPTSRDLAKGVPADARDSVTLLTVAAGRPPRAWRSRLARALEQAGRLHETAARSGGALRVVRSRADLDGPQRVSAVLAVEGLHALDGDPDNIAALLAAGFRMFGLVHLADNEIAGSSTGEQRGGLTPLGREVVTRIEEAGGIVDLAHASPAAIDEVLARATRPVVVSHTGAQATAPGRRNLSDAHIEGVAATGGLVGVGLWPDAVGAADPSAAARAICHVAGLVGVEHAAVGSDFDGAVATPFDASGWARLTEALLVEGIGEDEVAAIMGGNARRLLRMTLPA